MAQLTINIGAAPNDNSGDDLRAGAIKINTNFTELYTFNGTLGTVRTYNVGVSGGNVPLLNGTAHVWSNSQTFGIGGTGSGTIVIALDGPNGTGGGSFITFKRNGGTIGYVGSHAALTAGNGSDLALWGAGHVILHAGASAFVKSDNTFVPSTDNTLYLGKNDDDTPLAWKGLILKDQSNGKYYRIEMVAGTITATDLTD